MKPLNLKIKLNAPKEKDHFNRDQQFSAGPIRKDERGCERAQFLVQKNGGAAVDKEIIVPLLRIFKQVIGISFFFSERHHRVDPF